MRLPASILRVLLILILPNAASCQGPASLPSDIVVPVVDAEMDAIKQLKKKPICLTVDGGNPPRETLERLHRSYPGLEKSGTCFGKQKGVDLIIGTLASSSDEIQVLVKVGDPRLEEGSHFATLLREMRYKFQRDSAGNWKLASKTQTCCDEPPCK